MGVFHDLESPLHLKYPAGCDVRFLGSPIDLVVFDGLAEGRVRRIVFLEVKTGGAGLTSRERWVRDVIQAQGVEWAELRVTRPFSSGAA